MLHQLDDGWEPYWLDTVQIPEGKSAQIAFVADNPDDALGFRFASSFSESRRPPFGMML
jgi:hypothetical protein